MSADLLRGHIIKGENVLDYAVLVLVDSTLFSAGVGHHHDLLLGDGVVLLVGVDAYEAQHRVCGDVEHPHERREHYHKKAYDTCHTERELFGIFGGDLLGDELAEYNCQVRDEQGQHDCGSRMNGFFG